ncbi:MAG: rhodanese-like domain-containing protein [Chloroflexi bacterium]|nr:rhodanese-like domain-containing protein [Chloroflexota bacterium]
MILEIAVEELANKLKSQDQFILLDVREPSELEYAKITDARLEVAPMSRLGREGINMLSESAKSQTATIYVLCHHGARSAQVSGWLASQGWSNVFSVRGGINEYARKVDRSVGMY